MYSPRIRRFPSRPPLGLTLVELMVAIAVLSVIVSIAVPSYRGYVREGQFTTIRANLNTLRTVVEDYQLDKGSYGPLGQLSGLAAIDGRYRWNPGDIGNYIYTVNVTSSSNYDAWGQAGNGSAVWVRCEDRFSTCCDSDSSSGATPSDSC